MASMWMGVLGRTVVAATTALLAVALAAGPALADTELGHTGKVGIHFLTDTLGDPGVICHYGNDLLEAFEVVAPTVYGRDRIRGRESQKVGWRIIISRRMFGSALWSTFHTSSIVKRTAFDDQSASWPDRIVAPRLPVESPGEVSSYAIWIKMFWYRSDGSVAGTAKHAVDFYLVEHGHEPQVMSSCDSGFPP